MIWYFFLIFSSYKLILADKMTLSAIIYFLSSSNYVKDFFCKCYNNSSELMSLFRLARCVGSCDFRLIPTCTTPNPKIIIPTALIKPKIKLDRLFTTLIGSSAAKTLLACAINKATTYPIINNSLIKIFFTFFVFIFSFII